jgi:hypothetical protein
MVVLCFYGNLHVINEADSMLQTRVAMAVPSQNEEETQSSIPVNCVKINLVNRHKKKKEKKKKKERVPVEIGIQNM